MKLITIASSSDGNGYFLISDSGQILMLEAGVKIKEQIRHSLFDIKNVIGCLITHEHDDHALYARQYAEYGIELYCSRGTAKGLKQVDKGYLNIFIDVSIPLKAKLKIGEYSVIPFKAQHDCNEPLGYFINHPESGNILFATDTFYLPYKFQGINHIIIECNYDDDILEDRIQKGEAELMLRNRVLNSHMELNNLVSTLRQNDLKKCRNIVLIHLSSSHINEAKTINKIEKETGKPTFIADKSKNLNLNKNPF